MKILHELGITVASSTINKEKKHLIKEQEKKLSATMLKYVHSYYSVPENPRNLNVRYGIEVIGDNLDVTSCQDDNVVSEKEPSLVFDYGEIEKDYGK